LINIILKGIARSEILSEHVHGRAKCHFENQNLRLIIKSQINDNSIST